MKENLFRAEMWSERFEKCAGICLTALPNLGDVEAAAGDLLKSDIGSRWYLGKICVWCASLPNNTALAVSLSGGKLLAPRSGLPAAPRSG